MKTFRTQYVGVLPRIEDGQRLVVVSVTVFSLDDALTLLTEPSLWQAAREELGEDVTIDALGGDACDDVDSRGIAARAFIQRVTGEVIDIDMRPHNTIAFPGANVGAVVHRGTVEISDDEAEDVAALIVGAEHIDRPKSREHYETVLAQRLDPDRGHLYVLRDADLLPEGTVSDPLGIQTAMDSGPDMRQQRLRRRATLQLERARQSLVAQNIDPDQHLPEALPPPEQPPRPDELPAWSEAHDAELERFKADGERRRAEAVASARRDCEAQGIDYDRAVEEAQRDGGGPPKAVPQRLEEMRARQQLGRNAGTVFHALEQQLRDPALASKLEDIYRAQVFAYRRAAHHMPAARMLAGADAQNLRAEVERAHRAEASLAGRDLTGADLSGIDLAGANLEGAFLEHADLSAATLTGANLADAVLTRTNLSGADLSQATLRDANLGSAILVGAKLDEAVLVNAILHGADCSGASLCGADLTNADLSEANLDDADLERADLSEVTFIATALAGQKLSGAKLHRAVFMECDLSGADLRGAELERVAIVKTKADGADLRNATGKRLCIAHSSSLSRADFRGAAFEGLAVLDTNLDDADLSGAELAGANFNKSSLSGAKLCRSNLAGAMLMKANLRGADLSDCNLMNASLRKAQLHAADLAGANLFRCDMSKSQIDDDTRFDDALTLRARTEGRVET